MSDSKQMSTLGYLPAVYRMRDEEQGGPLEALLQVIDEQVRFVSASVRQMYDDLYIETCRGEFVPYIGELLGGSVSSNLLQPNALQLDNKALGLVFPRRQAAEAVSLQRRKGTLPVLEELSMIVAGWYAHAEEWYPRVAQFQDTRRLPHHIQGLANDGAVQAKEQRAIDLERRLLGMGQTVDVRQHDRSGSLDGAFAQGAHFSDFKPARSDFYPKYSKLLRLHIYRLNVYGITQGRPKCVRTFDIQGGTKKLQLATLDAAGVCRALYINPEQEIAATDISREANLPLPLTRSLLVGPDTQEPGKSDSPTMAGKKPTTDCHPISSNVYYGRGKSLQLWLEQFDAAKKRWVRVLIPKNRVLVCDLSKVLHGCEKGSCDSGEIQSPSVPPPYDSIGPLATIDEPPTSSDLPLVAIDPECGAMAYVYGDQRPFGNPQIVASFYYGFSADMGGGEYNRVIPETTNLAATRHIRVRRDIAPCPESKDCQNRDDLVSLASTILRQQEPSACRVPKDITRTIIEIADSDSYRLPCRTIKVPRGTTFELRASNHRFPTIELACNGCNPALEFQLATGAAVVLDGIRLHGGRVVFSSLEDNEPAESHPPCERKPELDPIRRITIRNSTLLPQVEACNCCANKVPTILENQIEDSVLTIDHSITSMIVLHRKGNNDDKPLANRLLVLDSIVDGQNPSQSAISGAESTILRTERSTILGSTSVRELSLAQDSIFSCPVTTARRQPGGMRFCYVPPNCDRPSWKTPQQYYCQPSQSYERLNLEQTACSRAGRSSAGNADKSNPIVTTRNSSWRDIRLSFTACLYGHAGYAQLQVNGAESLRGTHNQTCACSPKAVVAHPAQSLAGCPCVAGIECSGLIRQGAESGSEMGAFHNLFQPQRESNLRRRIEEFTPMSMNCDQLFVN